MRCKFRSVSMKLAVPALLLSFMATAAHAQSTAVTITPDPANTGNNGFQGYSLGFAFNTTELLTVTDLGWFNAGTLTMPHQIGIYSSGGVLLTSASVPLGAAVTAADPFFSYVPIAPVQLPAATEYEIVGVTGTTDPYALNPVTFATGPGVNFVGDRFQNSSTLQFATGTLGVLGRFGPNFKFFVATPTPEFGSVFSLGGLLAAGGTGLWLRGRRRVKRSTEPEG